MNLNLVRSFRATRAVIIFTCLLGVGYTGVVTGISQVAFPYQANGSLIEKDGKILGSALMSQRQTGKQYLWGRYDVPDKDTFEGYYYGAPTNLTTVSKEYKAEIVKRAQEIGIKNPPIELVTGSGSGLDPHISLSSALVQVPRIAEARNLSDAEVKKIIDKYTDWNFGAPITNVLEVNLALDSMHSAAAK